MIFTGVVIGPAVFTALVAAFSFQIAYACMGVMMLTSVFAFLRAGVHVRAGAN